MPEIHTYKMTQMLQKPVFALPGCQRTSVNTLLCDTLALADQTELRTLNQICEQTLRKLQTHRIMNKRTFLRKGHSNPDTASVISTRTDMQAVAPAFQCIQCLKTFIRHLPLWETTNGGLNVSC